MHSLLRPINIIVLEGGTKQAKWIVDWHCIHHRYENGGAQKIKNIFHLAISFRPTTRFCSLVWYLQTSSSDCFWYFQDLHYGNTSLVIEIIIISTTARLSGRPSLSQSHFIYYFSSFYKKFQGSSATKERPLFIPFTRPNFHLFLFTVGISDYRYLPTYSSEATS